MPLQLSDPGSLFNPPQTTAAGLQAGPHTGEESLSFGSTHFAQRNALSHTQEKVGWQKPQKQGVFESATAFGKLNLYMNLPRAFFAMYHVVERE